MTNTEQETPFSKIDELACMETYARINGVEFYKVVVDDEDFGKLATEHDFMFIEREFPERQDQGRRVVAVSLETAAEIFDLDRPRQNSKEGTS